MCRVIWGGNKAPSGALHLGCKVAWEERKAKCTQSPPGASEPRATACRIPMPLLLQPAALPARTDCKSCTGTQALTPCSGGSQLHLFHFAFHTLHF